MSVCVDLSGADRLPLARALAGAERVARAPLVAGGQPVRPRALAWPCAGEALNLPHAPGDLAAPDVDLLVVRRAVAGGAGAHLKLDDRFVYADDPYPYYVRHWCEHDIARAGWDFDAPVARSLDRAFVITHFNYVWGHWLTEMYPKLFVIRALNAAGVVAPLLLPATAPAYVARIARRMLPDLEIVTYDPRDEAVEIGLALLPPMLHRNYVFHDLLRWGLEQEALTSPRAGRPEAIFVSRGGVRAPTAFREMANEAEIEGIAQEMGLALLRPETLPWEEQARIFAGARLVAGEFGSGLHNALLSPEGCQVVSLNWVTDVQSRIANFRGHDVGYILPTDGRPRLFSVEAQVNQPFTIDPADFRRKLAIALERAETRAGMAGWNDAPDV
ncbi:DUF563 domain-containing protein [uncultured Caulobacter sp.]|uniref:glycosyltransferase family 61 protein n=1 Tax=uncultured Caulobacter sp. TaxID=158749 RepID=UPI00260EC90E|nr:DUF563 domain-containing protein [uncultured Caulobacter sp.]